MQWLRQYWIAVLTIALLNGCRKGDSKQPPPAPPAAAAPSPTQSHEMLVKEAIASMRNAASALNGVADAASAEKTVTILKRETQNLKLLHQRLTDLGRASGSERERVKQHSQDNIPKI
jgi:hypothetical protein